MYTKTTKDGYGSVIIQSNKDESIAALEKLIKMDLPEEVRIALEAMRRTQHARRRKEGAARQPQQHRYFPI